MDKPPSLLKGIVTLLTDYDYATAPVIHPFKETFGAQTIGGFKFKYTISGSLEMGNHDEFTKHRMLEPQRQKVLVESLHGRILEYLNRTNHFWVISWTKYRDGLDPLVLLCLVDSGRGITVDYNCAAAIREIKKGEPYTGNGCSLFLKLITPDLGDAKLNEENVKMLSSTQLEAIKRSEVYQAFGGLEAVGALQKRLEIAKDMQRLQTEQAFGETAHFFKVKTRMVGSALQIDWTLKDGHKHAPVRGFRKSGAGFPCAHINEKGIVTGYTGEQIIDTIEDGSVIQKLEEGKEYSFGLFIEKSNWAGDRKVVDCIQFSISVPPAKEVQLLEEKLGKISQRTAAFLNGQESIAPDERKLREIIGPIEKKSDRRDAILDFKERKIGWIRQQGYSKEKEG